MIYGKFVYKELFYINNIYNFNDLYDIKYRERFNKE